MKEIKFGGQHIAYLDGIRGVAILYVMLSHTSNNGWNLLPNINMAMSGKIGVWLFFILSSFLLTTQILNAYKRGAFNAGFLASFFIARWFRIYPLYIFVLLWVVAVVGWFTASEFWLYLTLQETSHHLWAIPVEFKFYLMLPLIFMFYAYFCRENLLLFLAPFILFYVLLTPYGGCFSVANVLSNDLTSLWKHLPVFLLGFVGSVLLAKGFSPPKWATILSLSAIIILTPMLLVNILSSFGIDLSPLEKRGLVFGVHMEFMVGSLWLIVVLGSTSFHAVRKFFEMKFLVLTGQISFSLYLLHYFLFPPLRDIHMAPSLKAWALFAFSYIIAFLSFRYIEKSGMQAGKTVLRKLGLRK